MTRALKNLAAMVALGAFAVSLLRARHRAAPRPGLAAWGLPLSRTVH